MATGGGVFIVPLDVDGVTRGKPTDKVGQRPLNQGEIFFDDVVIPADHMIAGPDQYDAVLGATEALSIYGGAGITRENPIEKLMRDASVSVIEDGENTLLGLVAADRL